MSAGVMSRPRIVSPLGNGTPVRLSRVGYQSRLATGKSNVELGAILPGHRTAVGTKIELSYMFGRWLRGMFGLVTGGAGLRAQCPLPLCQMPLWPML